MKRNRMYLIPIAFVAALALISVLFRADENTEFGNVRDRYALTDTVRLEGVEGDTKLLEPLLMHPTTSLETPRIDFMVGDKALALTGWEYADGRLYSTIESKYRYGTFKYLSAERHIYDNLSFGASPGVGPDGLPCPVLEANSTFSIGVKLPIHDPGKYRVTYYFRECLDAENLTTGDTLYSVSHIVTIEPEKSTGEEFDVAGVQLIDYTGNGDPELPAHRVKILLRTHMDLPMLWKRDTVRLETLVNNEWVQIDVGFDRSQYETRFTQSPGGGAEDALLSNRLDEWLSGFTHNASDFNCWVTPYIEIPEPSPSREYRLTLEFADSPMPDAARYALQLTLYLDFN